MIDAAKRVAGSTARPVEVDDAFLADQGVGEWMELPLWVDTRNEPWRRFMEVDASRATAAGLTFRALEDTVAAAPPRRSLSTASVEPERERSLLAAGGRRLG